MSCKPMTEASFGLLERIARHLYLNADYVKDVSLLNGSSGIALFFYYYARLQNDQFYADYADELFDSIYSDLSRSDNFDHATGICGVAVFIQHLLSNDFISAGDEDVLSVVDESISNAYECNCKGSSSTAEYPFSIANYYLKRWESDKSLFNSILPYADNLVNDLLRQVTTVCSVTPADTWRMMMRSVLQNESVHSPVMNASSAICLLQLKKLLPAASLLNDVMSILGKWQEDMLNWLNDYWEHNKNQISGMEDYYWVEYFLIVLRYGKLVTIHFADGGAGDQLLVNAIRDGFGRIVGNKKACSDFHGNFIQGDPWLILIGNAMHRYTEDDLYAVYTTCLLNKFLEPHPFAIGGSSLMNGGSVFLSVDKGHAGIGLLLLASIAGGAMPWESLLGHYDISANLREENISLTLKH